VSLGDDVKEQIGGAGVARDVTEFIEDEHASRAGNCGRIVDDLWTVDRPGQVIAVDLPWGSAVSTFGAARSRNGSVAEHDVHMRGVIAPRKPR
jgi:hypothetical protein